MNPTASPIWHKSTLPTAEIERFTVGRDRELDLYLAESDVLGSMAHITMLQSIGLLTADELQVLLAELRCILGDIRAGKFLIEEGVEDVHSEVELLLTRRLGDVGKKIHSGRSRNDQVLVDLKLWTRRQLHDIVLLVKELFDELQRQSEFRLPCPAPSAFGLALMPRALPMICSSCKLPIASSTATPSGLLQATAPAFRSTAR